MHDCKSELRDVDLRATPARIALLQVLEKTSEPLDASKMLTLLHKKGFTIDQATVFRMIHTFTEKGLTKQISLHEGKFRYELSTKEEHHHLICQECSNIEDITDCGIDKLEKEIKKKKKFIVKNHSLEFFGVCQQCQR